MLAYDTQHPEVFLRADRALERFAVIESLRAAAREARLLPFLASHGNPGDYVPQGVVYLLAGKYALITAQAALALFSGYALFGLAANAGLGPTSCRAATILYLALPHTLIFPHQLATEAISTPLLVISLWLLSRSDGLRMSTLAASALVTGIATLVRPITVLWPALVSVALLITRRASALRSVAFLAIATTPLIAWMLFMHGVTGRFEMGESSRDLGHNLHGQVANIIATMPEVEAGQATDEYLSNGARLSVPDYLRFALDHPGPVLLHTVRGLSVFAAKSGIERITIDYLDLDPAARTSLQRSGTGWRRQMERDGVIPALYGIWREHRLLMTLSVLGAGAMLLLSTFALIGAYAMFRRLRESNPVRRFIIVLILALPAYILVFSQVVIGFQSRHRAPAEPAIVVLAIAGVAWLHGRLRRRARIKANGDDAAALTALPGPR